MTDINSFESACAKLGRSTQLPDMSSWPSSLRRPMIALYKLTVIRDAIVGDWVPDWDDNKQRKWYPWFYLNKPGFRFLDSYFALTYSHSAGGSRLVFASEAQSDYAGKTFLGLYEEWLTIMPEALAVDQPTPLQIAVDQTPASPRPFVKLAKEVALEAALSLAHRREAPFDVLAEAKKFHKWLTAE